MPRDNRNSPNIFRPVPVPEGRMVMMSFCSGSCGNCYFLANGEHAILIDAGVSFRRLRQTLQSVGHSPEEVEAILLTHDHMDHVRGLGSLCKVMSVPVYATPAVHSALSGHPLYAPYIQGCRRNFPLGERMRVAGMEVRNFEVPHDATQTVGYYIQDPLSGENFLMATDIGRPVRAVYELAAEATTLVIESNYDIRMLMAGPYPYELKMRICKGHGHLSNDECARVLREVVHPRMHNIFLCHLSENNNTPAAAFATSSAALADVGVPEGSISLRALPRRTASPLFVL